MRDEIINTLTPSSTWKI